MQTSPDPSKSWTTFSVQLFALGSGSNDLVVLAWRLQIKYLFPKSFHSNNLGELLEPKPPMAQDYSCHSILFIA